MVLGSALCIPSIGMIVKGAQNYFARTNTTGPLMEVGLGLAAGGLSVFIIIKSINAKRNGPNDESYTITRE